MKVKLFLGLALGTLMLNSCQTEKVDETIGKVADKNEQIDICIDKTLNTNLDGKGSVLTSTKWATGTTIKIKFLNGDTFFRNKVKQFAAPWLTYANIYYQWVGDNEYADIKIGFKIPNQSGSWSYLAKDCLAIPQNQPSMHFGWFEYNTSDAEFSRVVTHEFGHALGLIHEHSQPNATISWNMTNIYEYYRINAPSWKKEQIDYNYLYKYSATETNSSTYDPQSIMMYGYPASFTNNGVSLPWNYYLSSNDKSFIATVYPFPPSTQNVSTIFGEPNLSWTGWVIRLPVGNYTMAQLAARGIPNDAISSLVTNNGYEAVMYFNDNFQGTSKIYTNLEGSFPNMGGIFPYNHDNQYSSVAIRRK